MPIRSATAALGLAAVLLWPRPGGADPSRITLQDVFTLAREHAPALVEARARVRAAQGPLASAAPLLRENPQLDVQVGPRRLPNGVYGLDLALGLSQPFELGGKQGLRRDAARAGLSMEEARLRDAERLLLGDVAAAYLRLLQAGERKKLVEAAAEAAARTVKATEQRYAAGDVPAVDVNVAKVAHARARADLQVAAGEIYALREELEVRVGYRARPLVTYDDDLRSIARAPVREVPDGAGARADLVALEQEQVQATAAATLGRRQVLPDVTVGARYQKEADETVFLGTLSVPLPLFARGQEARLVGEADASRAEQELTAARTVVPAQVQAAKYRYRASLGALGALEQILPLLDDNEALAQRSYDAGEMDLAAFLLVRRDTLEARAAWLEGLLRLALARVQLEVETGVLP
ncbi:TolC family protein [Corallococcus exiguus]|uniref:TolC family protein n=1 Tax=Corallococcus TaxID=83461 RepID=UPI000ED47071|nr:TolC family protein [Corallococcus sp. AB032C]NNB86636.1 TolC family protein [Corallococcus exiguus]NNB93512.1 TolC family protein [Corallococcus exiguus]NNC06471.1 TolC family protein [Corallococcus exiguus]NPC52101.1 TolC family protein [Corallococcus exiguus]RKH78620.1 TolC family protein [Corallococcus sp. AB032C]